MEEILGQVMLPPIKFKDFLNEYKQMFQAPYTLPCGEVDFQEVLQLGADRIQELEDEYSHEYLDEVDDARVAEFVPGFSEMMRIPNTNVPLQSIKLKSYDVSLKSKEPNQRKGNPFKRSPELYFNYREPQKESISSTTVLLPEQELKILVRLYRPARVTHAGRTIERPVFSQEFECLGSNYLTELRDKIFCICNDKRFFDVSEDPEAPLPSKETDPGYFFITDTFYNDKRHPSNADYSETIRNWAKKAKGLSHLKFNVAQMEKTRMIDLTVSMGFPQLYQHHGNCEHVFVFSQLEVVTNPQKQVIALANYPYVKSVNRFTSRTCHICSKVNFVFVVEGSTRLIHDPAYMCRQCFKSFHYVDGKKVGDFRAYRVNEEPIQISENLEPVNEEENSVEDADEISDELNDSVGDIDDMVVKVETNYSE